MAASSESVLDDLLQKLGANAPPLPEPKMPSLYEVECKKGDMEPVKEHENLLQKIGTLRLLRPNAKAEILDILTERKQLVALIHTWTARAWHAAEREESTTYAACMKWRARYLRHYDSCMQRMELVYLLKQV